MPAKHLDKEITTSVLDTIFDTIGFAGLVGVSYTNKNHIFYIKRKDNMIDSIEYKFRDDINEDSLLTVLENKIISMSIGLFSSRLNTPAIAGKYKDLNLMPFTSKYELVSYMRRTILEWIKSNDLESEYTYRIECIKNFKKPDKGLEDIL